MAEPITGSIEVEAPVAQVYEYWRNLENLPSFMKNIEEVRSTGPDTTHWVVKGPLGYRAEFDARTTQDEQNSAIGWNTVDGDVQTSGQVRFQEMTPNRTKVEVQMKFANPPGGKAGEAVSRLTSGPKAIMLQDLKNFKDIMEGTATPEEIQQRPAVADAHSGAIATLTSGTGLAVIGGVVLLWLLLRRGGGGSSKSKGKSRIIFEF
ncbi:MAG: SRPBCC family protein [Rubrobacteraceae bacterium]|nr:SRPBCC family protein [Rubrobacteraceae bacterium]